MSQLQGWQAECYYLDCISLSLPGSLCNPSLLFAKQKYFQLSCCHRRYHQHCHGRIYIPDKNKSETAAVLPPAGKLTFLRWTEILFFVYVILARPSAGIPWENQHLSPFYRKNFKQSCWLVFPNVAFSPRTEQRGGRHFQVSELNQWRLESEVTVVTVVCNIGNNLPRFSLSTKPTTSGVTPDLLSW